MCTGLLLRAGIGDAGPAALHGRPSRVAGPGAARPQGCMDLLFHTQKRALLTSTRAHTHSPLTPMAGASQRQLGTVCSMHARSL